VRRLLRPLVLLAGLASIVAVVGLPGSAAAHSGKQSYVYFSVFDHELEGRVEIPVVDLEEATGIAVPQQPAAARAAVRENLAELQQYASDHLQVGDGTTEWDLRFEDFSILPVAGTYVVLPFTVDERFDDVPRELRVVYDGIIESNPEKDAVVLVDTDWRSATFNEETNELLFYSVGQTDQVLVLDDASIVESLLGVRGLGTDAFRTGIPHLLIVAALLLPVALAAAGRRLTDPAPSLPSAGRRLGIVLGVLVLSHSLTLWLTGLGVTDLSERRARQLVELAVLAAAVWAVLAVTRPSVVRFERGVVAVLGIVQGLGLGWTFLQFDLDRSRPILSLVGFNVGVEVGIAVLTLLLFPTLLLLRRTVLAPAVLYVGALVVAAYGVGWIAQRAGLGDEFMDDVANPLRVWPRNGLILLVAMALAGGMYAWDSARGRLRPVEGAPIEAPSASRDEPAEKVPT
jgi:hypothetical protein